MTAASPPRPPKQSPPCERDLKIFRLAEIHGLSHDGIVVELGGGITRRRVSQIVQDVRRWLATHPCPDDSLATDIEHKRYTRQLERMYLQNVIDRAIDGLNHAPKTLATTRTLENTVMSRTEREQPPVDVRLLRTYLRAVTALGKLNEREELPLPPPPPKEPEPWMHGTIQEVVKRWQLKRHSYLLGDTCLEKFAEDLSVAFLDYLEEHPPAPSAHEQPEETETFDGEASEADGRVSFAHHSLDVTDVTSSASHVSHGEAPTSTAASAPALDATDDSAATSAAATTASAATNEAERPCEKFEKGSAAAPAEEDRRVGCAHQSSEAEDEYVRPLWIGPLPPDHPALREGPPLHLRPARPLPIVEVQINPSEPGASVRVSEEHVAPPPPTAANAPP